MKIDRKKIINPLIITILALLFFIFTSSFNVLTQKDGFVKWNSPDETANYFFSKKFAEEGDLKYFEDASALGGNIIMPRSLRSDDGWVKPVSFLGIILTYGGIGSVLGSFVIPFLTPFFAALGIIFFYLLIKRLFNNERIGLISAFLLASFPVYIYYTVRSMFHNILFIVFCLIAFYLLSLALGSPRPRGVFRELKRKFFSLKQEGQRWRQFIWTFLAGIFAGLAIITRMSELIWLIPAVGLIWLFYSRRFGFIKLFLFLAGIFLTFIPLIYYNSVLYDNPWRGGYNEMNRSLEEIGVVGEQLVTADYSTYLERTRDYGKTLFNNIFYFGFDSKQSITMFENYVLKMFPLFTSVAFFGAFLLLLQNVSNFKKKYLAYFLAGIVLSIILVFYYGSWLFNDNPDPDRFTIGNSYTRYWLPIYLFLMPLASFAIFKISQAFSAVIIRHENNFREIISGSVQSLIILVFVVVGIRFVLFGSEEGLVYTYYNNLADKKTAQEVIALTEENSIIITQYYDKFLFPDRKIIMGRLPQDYILEAVQKLLNSYPVYYYNFYLPEKDYNYLNERRLPEYGLQLDLIKKMNASFGLYQLKNVFESSVYEEK